MWNCRDGTVSEWLRSRTRNPMGSARRGSNPLGVGIARRCIVFSVARELETLSREGPRGVMDNALDF